MTILRRHLSRFQWVMAWEAAFHPEVPHSPPLPDQWGSPEKARHCRWGQNLLAEWKRQCHLFLFLTLIVRIQYEKVTPIITFFAKKKRACFPWCGKQAQLEISCHAKECNRTSEWWASHWHPVPSPCGTSGILPD